jgi:hypothetical protein
LGHEYLKAFAYLRVIGVISTTSRENTSGMLTRIPAMFFHSANGLKKPLHAAGLMGPRLQFCSRNNITASPKVVPSEECGNYQCKLKPNLLES